MYNEPDPDLDLPPATELELEAAERAWQPILHASNQIVLYNPTSHALSIRREQPRTAPHTGHHHAAPAPAACPYCHRPLPPEFVRRESGWMYELEGPSRRADNYFELLAVANETLSRPPTPAIVADGGDVGVDDTHKPTPAAGGRAFKLEHMAEGYFNAFFQEECKLGMGANGSVYLCQHVIDGNILGSFAVKKIAVGESHSYLLKILREVRLLERLHHPNIVTYHHSWLESCQFSAFGPKVPTLFILMQLAEGGSLDDLIEQRLGRLSRHAPPPKSHPSTSSSPGNGATVRCNAQATESTSTISRIRAFRAFQRASPAERERLRRAGLAPNGGDYNSGTWKAVHLLSAEEVRSLFGDVVDGLSFLHERSILHLDLKPGNVLLTWDEGRLIPRAMLSDFGTSRDMMQSSRVRTGNTGTLEYASPESLPSPATGFLSSVDSKSDVWSLGMILHKMLFFRLPYRHASDGEASNVSDPEKLERLEKEVLGYSGFKMTPKLVATLEMRRLPRTFLSLLESLLHVMPSARPSCDRVSIMIREGKLDSITHATEIDGATVSLVPVSRRTGSGPSSTVYDDDSLLQSPQHDTREHREAVVVAQPETQAEVEDAASVAGDAEVMRMTVSHGPWREKERLSPVLLSLPAPSSWTWWRSLWWRSWRSPSRMRSLGGKTHLIARMIKSVALAAKVWSVSSLCLSAGPWVVSPLLAAAVLDMWTDEIAGQSLVLGCLHVGVVWMTCRGRVTRQY